MRPSTFNCCNTDQCVWIYLSRLDGMSLNRTSFPILPAVQFQDTDPCRRHSTFHNLEPCNKKFVFIRRRAIDSRLYTRGLQNVVQSLSGGLSSFIPAEIWCQLLYRESAKRSKISIRSSGWPLWLYCYSRYLSCISNYSSTSECRNTTFYCYWVWPWAQSEGVFSWVWLDKTAICDKESSYLEYFFGQAAKQQHPDRHTFEDILSFVILYLQNPMFCYSITEKESLEWCCYFCTETGYSVSHIPY